MPDWRALADAAAASPQTGALYLVDAQGRLRFSTRAFPAGPEVSFADRDFFRAMAGQEKEPYVGRSFFEPETRRPCFPIARRIVNPDGSFGGVVIATVESEYFREFYRALGFSEHAAFGIYKHDGGILVRYPMVEADVGRTIPANAPMLQLVPAKPVGSFRAVSTYDYFHRVVSYRKVEDPAIILWVGTTEEDALEAWKKRLFRNAGLVLASLFALLVLSRLALRGLQREEQATRKLGALFELSPIGMVYTDTDGRFIEVNPAFLAMVGLSADELSRLTWSDLTPVAYHAEDRRHLESLLQNGRYGPYEKEYVHKDGHLVPVALNGAMVRERSGEAFIWSTVENIAERKQAEAATQLAASVFDHTAEAILITDADTRILSVNRAFTEISGYAAAEVIGKRPSLLKSQRHTRAFYEELWAELLAKGVWQGQIWNRRRDGEAYLAWQTISTIADRTGKIQRFVAVSSDMTELHRKDEQIRHLAYHDALTGLPNRLLLQDRLAQAIEVARREREQVAVMFIDLDRFKVINDSLGHEAGDSLLIEASHRLQRRLRRSDTLARLGGDEFVVVLPFVETLGEVAEVAEDIIESFAPPILVAGHEMRVTASLGIAVFPRDGDDVGTLMRNADTAMYGAKGAGRNTFRFFDSVMNAEMLDRLNLEEALRRALQNREFVLFYQPKIDLATRQFAGVEALIRWQSPERGQVSPNFFIPLAEETGLILEIGDWVLEEACRQAAAWVHEGMWPVKVAVNVSARQFLDEGFADRVGALLKQYALDSSLIQIEMTETAVMSNPEQAVGQLQRLRRLGIGVAVDDFGTGYSSLNYLKRLPLTTIKIDRSFIRSVDQDSDNAAIVGAILGLAESLGLSVVAEGIETEGEERHLVDVGCPVAQGFRYSKPLPAGEFEAWLARHDALAPGRPVCCED
jgi:diguanylate cyclase (GGDEF)-like protein/PAS domain S-box-containing protein